jgi:hypothetical protein
MGSNELNIARNRLFASSKYIERLEKAILLQKRVIIGLLCTSLILSLLLLGVGR